MYRAWLHKVANDTGNDEEELHEFLLDRCAPRVVVTIKGPKKNVDIERVKRTSGHHNLSMTKDEMGPLPQPIRQLPRLRPHRHPPQP
jgi:hypothetical protein